MIKTKYRIGFKGKNQIPLFMFMKEYYENDEIINGKVVFEIKGKEMRELEKRLRNEITNGLFVIKSNLGYWNNKKGWIDNKVEANKYENKNNTLLENLKYFYLDLTMIEFENI
jgi:hypothetical protein